MLSSRSSSRPINPVVTAYKVYHLSSAKLDREARRQTPDLARLVAHATIIDNVRRWSRHVAEPTEIVFIDSDPFEDSASDEDVDEDRDFGEVTFLEIEHVDAKEWSCPIDSSAKVFEINSGIVEQQKSDAKSCSSPKRRPPPPPPSTSVYEFKEHSWRQNRPVMVREIAVEVEADD